MTEVNYDEVIRWLDFKHRVNNLKLKDIEWVRDDGTKIEVKSFFLERWKFMGMTNLCFVDFFLSKIAEGKEEELMKELEWKDVS